MSLMALNLATLNEKRLRGRRKCACLLSELSNLSMYISAMEETHFTCVADCWVLEDDYIVFQHTATLGALGSPC